MDRVVESVEEMSALGESLGRVAAPGDVIGLAGDLGAGKTCFVQGLAAGLGYTGRVTSPTFTLIHIYEGGRLTLYHADLYRLDDAHELEDIGLDDTYRQDGVAAVEWATKLPGALPADALLVSIDVVSETSRRVQARASGHDSAALLTRWVG